MFNDEVELVSLDDVVVVSLRSWVEWEEKDIGLLNCSIMMKNISSTPFDGCRFQFQTRHLIKLESITEF